MSAPHVAVFGVGANGGAIAAALADSGVDVTAFDPWPDHVVAVQNHEMSVTTPTGERTSRLTMQHLCQLAESRQPFDLIVLGVKAYDTRWACELLLPYLATDGTVVAVQNGMTLDTVGAVFGVHRSVGAVIEVAANLFVPGKIVQEAPMWLALGGETPSAQTRAVRAAAILSASATVSIVDDIRSAKWMKLVANACELVPSAILNLPLAEAIAQPGMYEFMLACGQEALDTALACGQQIVPIFESDVDESVLTRDRYVAHLLNIVLSTYTFPNTLTTVLQDWRKGRRAEIDDLNGIVVQAASDPSQTPLNAQVHKIALRIEAGEFTARLNNIKHLLADSPA